MVNLIGRDFRQHTSQGRRFRQFREMQKQSAVEDLRIVAQTLNM